jgi:hypothetical protein
VRERVDQELGRLVTGGRQHREVVGIEIRRDKRSQALGVWERLGIVTVDDDRLELVEAADVIVVAVRGYGGHLPLEQLGELPPQGADAEARVDQQIAVAPTDQEHVCPDQRQGVRLGNPQDAFVDLVHAEPSVRDAHAVSLPR